ncbi:GNAT family N-acetyltransferase [Pseudorhodoferax sp. Leaf274]|uniref:GNAT family N-acetyltransferase n=1 Tax=Pseudorhodoferax sp. Leaf274 TaxID=1736318 RepID=UPI001F3E60D1|nr:GNAT family N-acetyltransferase [Pseudorhodoferax sp. Leaf274]
MVSDTASTTPSDDVAMRLAGLQAHLQQYGVGDWSRSADLFLTPAWCTQLAAHGFVERPRPWLPMLVDEAARAALMLPLAETGDGLRSLSNYYCSLYGAVGHGMPGPDCWVALARQLWRHPHGAILDLQPLADDAGWRLALERALRQAGYWVDGYFCFGNWYLPVAGVGFDAYLAARPSALRHSIERGRRRLQRHGGDRLTIHTAAGAPLDAAMAAFDDVYGRSWKEPEPSPRFMPELMLLAAREGWLRLGVLELDGRPIAAQVWLVQAGKANIYKLAYVQGFERFSPGSVLTAALMAHVMDVDRVREVDYLTGDDAYKRDWMTHRRERTGLIAFHPLRLRGLLAAARHYGGKLRRRHREGVAPP